MTKLTVAFRNFAKARNNNNNCLSFENIESLFDVFSSRKCMYVCMRVCAIYIHIYIYIYIYMPLNKILIVLTFNINHYFNHMYRNNNERWEKNL